MRLSIAFSLFSCLVIAHEADDRVTDPVCGMRIKPSKAATSTSFGGRKFFF